MSGRGSVRGRRAPRWPHLLLIQRVGIPATNRSVNGARSTGPALFVGGTPLLQRGLFRLAPGVGREDCREPVRAWGRWPAPPGDPAGRAGK